MANFMNKNHTLTPKERNAAIRPEISISVCGEYVLYKHFK